MLLTFIITRHLLLIVSYLGFRLRLEPLQPLGLNHRHRSRPHPSYLPLLIARGLRCPSQLLLIVIVGVASGDHESHAHNSLTRLDWDTYGSVGYHLLRCSSQQVRFFSNREAKTHRTCATNHHNELE